MSRRASGMPLTAMISSPGLIPDFADGVPGSACNTITRPGRMETTLPNPLRVDFSSSFNCSNWPGSKKTLNGSSLRSIPGIAPS